MGELLIILLYFAIGAGVVWFLSTSPFFLSSDFWIGLYKTLRHRNKKK